MLAHDYNMDKYSMFYSMFYSISRPGKKTKCYCRESDYLTNMAEMFFNMFQS